jgi:putative Holliday junction resolvase
VSTAASAATQTLLGFDAGERRIGIAIGNTLTGTARALETVPAAQVWPAVQRLIKEWQPDAFVVGLPLRDDGSETQGTAPARRFAGRLQGRFGKPVALVDERYTSVAAEERYGKMAPVDHHAAALILQQHLDALSTLSGTVSGTASEPSPDTTPN